MSNEMTRRNHEENPSPLHYLYESDARQVLTDFFLELGTQWDEEEEPLTKADIIERTGLQRKSVIDHIDALVALGIVETTGTEEGRWERYYPNVDTPAFEALHEANNELYRNWKQYQDEQSRQ